MQFAPFLDSVWPNLGETCKDSIFNFISSISSNQPHCSFKVNRVNSTFKRWKVGIIKQLVNAFRGNSRDSSIFNYSFFSLYFFLFCACEIGFVSNVRMRFDLNRLPKGFGIGRSMKSGIKREWFCTPLYRNREENIFCWPLE